MRLFSSLGLLILALVSVSPVLLAQHSLLDSARTRLPRLDGETVVVGLDSAVEVRRDTLLWYRLACFLPRALPPTTGEGRAALETDYAFVLSSLGTCARTF